MSKSVPPRQASLDPLSSHPQHPSLAAFSRAPTRIPRIEGTGPLTLSLAFRHFFEPLD